MTRFFLKLVFASVALFGSNVAADEFDAGQTAYAQYCATCHGANGNGDGPLTELMTTKIPDLTALSVNNDGEFPMLNVLHVIDGRTGLRAHGGSMPVYGALFDSERNGETTYGDVMYTRGKILSLAYYLESIQQ